MLKQSKKQYIVVDSETTGTNPHTCKLLGIAVNDGKSLSYGDNIPSLDKCQIVGQNIKYDLIVLRRHGYTIPAPKFDTMIAAYLLQIDKPRKLETMVQDLFNVHKDDLVQVYNNSTGESRVNLPENWFEKIDMITLAEYSMEDVKYTLKLAEYFSDELDKQPELRAWFDDIEMPLVDIITKMELKGVKIDRSKLTQLRDDLKLEVAKLHKRLLFIANSAELNFNSPKQLRTLLYEKFELPVSVRTASGEPSTDKATLKLLAKISDHAFPLLLLRYREIEKILSTYTDSLLDKLDTHDRIHTNYNQALTQTRRFSSEDPNLQNIPTRSDLGKRIKASFVPEFGHQFLVADYSQLEPRILAHLSDDKFLCQCFRNGEDIYNYTTSIVKDAGFKDFSRDKSKILFLALMYGKSAWGLANDWKCSETEAQSIIDTVFSKLQGVKDYIERVKEEAFKTSGWLKSLAGLPLFVGNPHSNDKWARAEVDRKAVNYPIQASSQDILKKAIVNIYNKSDKTLFPILMIHDELVFELSNKGPNAISKHNIISDMEHAWELRVPLKVEWKLTDCWTK